MADVHISAENLAMKALERIKAFPIGGHPKDTDKQERDDIVLIAREALRKIAMLASSSSPPIEPQIAATRDSSSEDLKTRSVRLLLESG